MEGTAVMDKNRLKAYFGKKPLEFETSDITLVYRGPGAQEESSYPDRIELTPEVSMATFYRAADSARQAGVDLDPVTKKLFSMVFKDWRGPITLESVGQATVAHRQTCGLLIATIALMLSKKQFVWKYPESGLHPRNEVELGDVIILLSQPNSMLNLIRKIEEENEHD